MEINPDQELQEQIDLYLEGSLNEEENLHFEKKMQGDPNLAYQVERLKISRTIIKNNALRERLKIIHFEEIKNNTKKLVDANPLIFKIAAGIIALVISLFLFKFFTLSTENLFLEKYKAYHLQIAGDSQHSDNSIIYSYFNKNYEDVIHIYKNKPSTSNEADFFAGVSFLELSHVRSAIVSFTKIVQKAEKGRSAEYFEASEFYLGCAYLKENQVDAAYWFFSKIYHDTNHSYHDYIDQWFYWKLRLLKFRNKFFS